MVAGGKGVWARRIAGAALFLSLGGVLAALVAAIGTGMDAWHFRMGFTVLRYAFFAAIAGGVLALVGLFLGWRSGTKGVGRHNALALAVTLAFGLYLGNQIMTARSVPAIHDIATDLGDVPQFRVLPVRADNLETVPDQGRPELEALPPEERWKAIHREAYGDIKPIRVRWSVPETIARAEALAERRGWDIAFVDAADGRMEATATTFFFRFKDDVVVRARPAPEGEGTIVDMRSISRVGVSDVGVNAERVREFLKDLRQG